MAPFHGYYESKNSIIHVVFVNMCRAARGRAAGGLATGWGLAVPTGHLGQEAHRGEGASGEAGVAAVARPAVGVVRLDLGERPHVEFPQVAGHLAVGGEGPVAVVGAEVGEVP